MAMDDGGCAWEKIRSLLVAGQCHTHDVTVRLDLGASSFHHVDVLSQS
jgi:hypothetical protein